MRIISANLNGIRSAATKGFFSWFSAQDADVLCLQETKAQKHQLTDTHFYPEGYHCYFHDAQTKKGYSGVALYAKQEPDSVITQLGWNAFDNEGRFIEARWGKRSVVSLYLPSGSSGEERQNFKFEVMRWLAPLLHQWQASGREIILCGDWNIAHKPIDLKNWKGNQKNSGFLPEERAWLDHIFNDLGWLDAFRILKPDVADEYTWWSNRGQARAKNVGWRIDYQIISPNLRDALRHTSIYRDQWFSDHAPLTLDYAC
jgi:exodeoxyribonuclease-3